MICAIACLCLNALRGKLASGEQYQTCVNKAVTSAFYKAGYPKRGVNPSLWREVPFDRSNKWSMITANPPNQDLPTSNYIRPNSRRLDLAYVQNGKIETLYDLKFPGDTPLASKDPDRLDDYREIAAKNHATFDEFIVEDRCHHCSDDEGNKKTLLEALGLAVLGLIMLLLLRGAPVEDMGPMPGGLEPGMA